MASDSVKAFLAYLIVLISAVGFGILSQLLAHWLFGQGRFIGKIGFILGALVGGAIVGSVASAIRENME